MKPCYFYGEELLVLAELIKDGEEVWQSCKARIGRGTPPSITTISKEVAQRAGWWTLPDEDAAPWSHQEVPVVLHCKLRVGHCELTTDVHVMDEEASFDQSTSFRWHIHLGESDMKALFSANWDADVCYLDAKTDPPSCCTSFTDALSNCHEDCMRYWHSRPIASPTDISEGDDTAPWSWEREKEKERQRQSCEEAARQPSAEALMYVHDIHGMSWDKSTCAAAAAAGSISCLSYAHCSGCPWDADVCSNAVEAGSMACLVYAHEHGCEWRASTCAEAARQGSMTFLMYAHEHGCEWGEETCMAAARRGHLDCLVYAHTNGCEWDECTCRGAAGSGNLEILAYAHESGCEWDESTCEAAAFAGEIDCLVYAHERGCPWDDTICIAAAQGGRLECLQYAHEQGCSWSEGTYFAAARAGSLECMMYAHEHGCPYDPAAKRSGLQGYIDGLTLAAVQGVISLPCLRYIHESMGCSCGK
ncbi:probable ankyrin repeat protein L59 at C-terminar half [Coccomyxa sp. Obi]|nr:probable ankyrin repeat protein L59 at C-terminar half [Coccomyxa sp. Obi]